MTEPQYVRVNVSTATSVPTYDENGNRKAEIDMMLPQNLVREADKVKSAKMALMKMQVPLAGLPGPTLKNLRYNANGNGATSQELSVGLWNPKINGAFTFEDRVETEKFYGSQANRDWALNVDIPEHLLSKDYKLHRNERIDEYELDDVQHLLKCVSRTLGTASAYLCKTPTDLQFAMPIFDFSVNPDDTISLFVHIRHCFGQHLPYGVGPRTGNIMYVQGTFLTDQHVSFLNSAERTEGPLALGTEPAYNQQLLITVNEKLSRYLPTLPWTKVRNEHPVYTGTTVTGVQKWRNNYNEEYFYVLRTDRARITIHRNENRTFWETPRVSPENVFTYMDGDTVEYNFPSSDATAIHTVSSIVLCMSGASFNQQVYPVNLSADTMSAAQTTTVPIIEVYYPMWTKPADLTTNLVIVKDTFSDAAPINISPSLLKERSIKFKIYYITTSGELKEMVIPHSLPFSFQICIELMF